MTEVAEPIPAPEPLDELPKRHFPQGVGAGRAERYPYDQWFTGRPLKLRHGVHFKSTPASMQANLHGAAKKRGIKVETRILPDGIAFQSIHNGQQPVEAEPQVTAGVGAQSGDDWGAAA